MRMNPPDRVFALGGAGKEIALTLLEQDWIVKNVLKPRPSPEELIVTIIDSADGEENTDIQRINELRKRINEYQNDLRDQASGRTGTISIEYKLITENIQLNSGIDLIGKSTVPRITSGNGMKEENWWLNERHINENLDFARGVVRKRGLGKSLYYKAYAEDDEMSSVIDLPEKGKVAVLGGLGGGTGSGLMMDIANHIKESQPTAEITLFGVLPNHFEGIEENTNAYAALSELEYLSLNGEDLFKDIMLFPIDPTGFDGKRGQMIQAEQELKQFDEALIYVLLLYYHTDEAGLEDPFQSSPEYAPFTMAIPQILRYNVESINQARESVRNILEKKREALESEEEIYSQVDRFLNRHYEQKQRDGLRDLDETNLKKQLEEVESLLSFDIFGELEYHSRSIFAEILDENDEVSIAERIDLIDAQVRAVDPTSQEVSNFVDDLDELLAEILEKGLRLIARRKELLERRKAIDESQIRDTVEYLMSTDGNDQVRNAGVKLQRLETKLDEIKNRRARLESEREETVQELERLREDQRDQIERQVDRWTRAVEEQLEQLEEFQGLSLERLFDELRSGLERFNDNVVNAADEDAVEQVSGQEVLDTLDQLSDQFEIVGMDFTDEFGGVERSLRYIKQAKTAQIQMGQEEGIIERLVPWQSSTEEMAETAYKDYKRVKQQIENQGVFSIGPPKSSGFSSEVTFDPEPLIGEVREQQSDLRVEVVSALEDRLESGHNETVEKLRDELARGVNRNRLSDIVEDAFEAEVSGTSGVRERKEEIEAELEEVTSQVDAYESTLELFDSIKQPKTTYTDNLTEYHQLRSDHEEKSNGQVISESDDYVYVKSIQPDDVFRATGSKSLRDSSLLNSRSETRRLQTQLEELMKNTRKQQYTGLRRRKFSKGRSRYENIKIRVGVSSPAIDHIDPEILDFEDIFSGAFNLGASGQRIESPYTTWQGDFGNDWDIGVTVFIDGIFLDNIRKVVQADGYRSSYLEQESQVGEDILIHHSFGLDRGFYIRRNEILNLEDSEDIGFYLRDDDAQITNDLLQNYTEAIDIDAPTPLDDYGENTWETARYDR